jgi:sugar lactone lactonase YvrE
MTVTLLFATSCKKNVQHPQSIGDNRGWTVATVGGDGSAQFADGPVLQARLKAPSDITYASNGALYVADALNHRIRRIFNGQVTTFAGFDREDTTSGVGSNAGYAIPIRLTSDIIGNVYTVDIHDFRIRKISPNGLVSVLAGSGVRGYADGRTDTARFGECSGIAVDPNGNVFVADLDGRRIRKISVTGFVTTIAGNGNAGFANGSAAAAEFFSLSGLVIDREGNLFVADWNRIRKITPGGQVTTFVGGDRYGIQDGDASKASFEEIADIVIDGEGNLFVSDGDRIRRISPIGEVTTIAGSIVGYRDGEGLLAQFNGANGLGIDADGSVYVAESHNNRIRKVSRK